METWVSGTTARLKYRWLAIHFPGWREWKLNICHWKGSNSLPYLQYTFPVEGNGNLPKNSSTFAGLINLQYTFPFEGNWNGPINQSCPIILYLQYTFPFEGNWNPTRHPCRGKYVPCNTLSRLKGIETGIGWVFGGLNIWHLQYTFPFEGNWNSSWL